MKTVVEFVPQLTRWGAVQDGCSESTTVVICLGPGPRFPSSRTQLCSAARWILWLDTCDLPTDDEAGFWLALSSKINADDSLTGVALLGCLSNDRVASNAIETNHKAIAGRNADLAGWVADRNQCVDTARNHVLHQGLVIESRLTPQRKIDLFRMFLLEESGTFQLYDAMQQSWRALPRHDLA